MESYVCNCAMFYCPVDLNNLIRDNVQAHPNPPAMTRCETYTEEEFNTMMPIYDVNSMPGTNIMLKRLGPKRLNTALLNAYYFPHNCEDSLFSEELLPIRPTNWVEGSHTCTVMHPSYSLYSRLTREDHLEEYLAVFASTAPLPALGISNNLLYFLMGNHSSYQSFSKVIGDAIRIVLGKREADSNCESSDSLLVIKRITELFNKKCSFAGRRKSRRKKCRNCYCWVYHLSREMPALPAVDYTVSIYVLRVTHPALVEFKVYMNERVISGSRRAPDS